MESYIIIVFIFGIIILILLILLYFVNKILQHKKRLDNSFYAIKEVLNSLEVLLDDILEFLDGNLEHEKSLRKRLSQTKDLIISVKNDKEGINTIHKIESEINNFINLKNTYEKIGKNKEYNRIKEEVLKNKDKLIYASDIYDKGVIDYNIYREKKLIDILSKLLKIPEYDCYNK